MKVHRSGYASIPGSSDLVTGASAGPDPLKRVVVHRDFIPVPVDVFDRLALDLEPEELAAYLQLFRLSVGEERNGCRVSRAELERRLRMSQLRIGKALAGLVEKKLIALQNRNREGTLYRVFLPEEVLAAKADAAQPARAARPSASSPRPAAPTTLPGPSATVGELAKWFLRVGGAGRGRSPDEVVQEILGLVEEGLTLDEVRAALEKFLAEAPKKTPIAELSRYAARG